jgi:tryptophan synthase alpha chain
MTGLARIAGAFAAAKSEGRAALMPYFTAGYPDLRGSEEVFCAIAEAGADLIEVGVPFSDPLADGPVIQASTQVALENGMSVAKCLVLVERLRDRGVRQPIMLMGYANPMFAYGAKRYVRNAAAAGADGLILADLPLEEATELEAACRSAGLALACLVAPTSTPERLQGIAGHTSGFLYLVSVTGVTGARTSLAPGLADFVERARQVAHTPLAVGFGVAGADQAAQVGRIADGVIVGSALIQAIGRSADGRLAAMDFVRSLRVALTSDTD